MEDLKYLNGSNPLYLKEVTYNYERIREYIKNHLTSFTFISNISEVDFLRSCSEKEFFSLDEFSGVIFDDSVQLLRNKLLDILNLFKGMFSTLFSIECVETKVAENENYCLLCLIKSSLKEVVSLRIDSNVGYINFLNIKEIISDLLENENLSFFSYFYQIGLSLIQENQPSVISMKKVIESKLTKFNVKIYCKDYIKTRERIYRNELPLIIEIGPSNANKNEVTIITKYENKQVAVDKLEKEIDSIIKDIDVINHKESMKKVIQVQKKQEDLENLKIGQRFCLCDNPNCREKVNCKLNNKKLYQSFLNITSNKKCIICNKPSSKVYFAG